MDDRPTLVSREDAINGLARRLHWKMEHLDPSEDAEWDRLTDRKKDFFRLCVEAIFEERTLSRSALL